MKTVKDNSNFIISNRSVSNSRLCNDALAPSVGEYSDYNK